MSTIQKFEDLKVWEKARAANLQIYKLSNNGSFSKDFGLRDQIRRASISIMSNIAEGFERNGNREFKWRSAVTIIHSHRLGIYFSGRV